MYVIVIIIIIIIFIIIIIIIIIYSYTLLAVTEPVKLPAGHFSKVTSLVFLARSVI